MPISLTAEEILKIHFELVSMFADQGDPISPPGPRDENLLASAAMRPNTSLGSVEKYPSVEEKGAALFHSLVMNHPFHNGNKRTALSSLLVLLDRGGRRFVATDDEMFSFVLNVATRSAPFNGSADSTVEAMAAWVRENTTAERGEPSIMDTKDFVAACERAGSGCRLSKDGRSWLVIGPNNYSLKINKNTRRLSGQVVKRYLSLLGLSFGVSGIHVEEFQEGLSAEQAVIRQYRNVLKRLAYS